MESKAQQPEYIDADSSATDALPGSVPGTQPILPPATDSNNRWQEIGATVSEFLEQLPKYVGNFFNQYKQAIVSFVLILAVIVTLKVLLAVLDAINDIPLLSPVFELIGMGYATWFVFRYLLTASKRQELASQFQFLQKETVGKDSVTN
jgi:hypothetical protein